MKADYLEFLYQISFITATLGNYLMQGVGGWVDAHVHCFTLCQRRPCPLCGCAL